MSPTSTDPSATESDAVATRLRVVVADDDTLLREGLASLLERSGFDIVGQVGDARDLLERVRDTLPELVIVDIRMPPTNTTEGLDAARQIRAEWPDTGILVLSAHVEAVDEVGHIGDPALEQVTDLVAACQELHRVLHLDVRR